MPNGHERRTIKDFVEALAQNEDLEALFAEEPIAVMHEFGLSRADQKTILLGSIQEIREALATQGVGNDVAYIIKIKMK